MSLAALQTVPEQNPVSLRQRTTSGVRERPDAHNGARAEHAIDIDATLTELFPMVRGQVFRLLGNAPDTDDVVQDALVELSKALLNYRGEAKVSTFAYRVTARVAFRAMKRRARWRLNEPLDKELELTSTPECSAIHKQALYRFRASLDRLPAKQRIAFLLCSVEGLPHQEAADVAEVSLETLRARLKRARKELGRLLRHDPVLSGYLNHNGGNL